MDNHQNGTRMPASRPAPATTHGWTLQLDPAPITESLQAIAQEQHESTVETRLSLEGLASGMAAMSAHLENQAKRAAASHACLQNIEGEQQRLSERAIRLEFLKPLARRIIDFAAALQDMVEEQATSDALSEMLFELLAAFGVDLIQPRPGDAFDPRTMKPGAGSRASGKKRHRVAELLRPGASSDGHVFECARVQIDCSGSRLFKRQEPRAPSPILPEAEEQTRRAGPELRPADARANAFAQPGGDSLPTDSRQPF